MPKAPANMLTDEWAERVADGMNLLKRLAAATGKSPKLTASECRQLRTVVRQMQ